MYLYFNIENIANAVIYIINDKCIVLSIHTNVNYRNKGYATKLLNEIKNYLIKNNSNINKITLDDCTDNFNTKDNLYLKFGFKYINDGESEMEFNINTQSNKQLND